MLINIALVAVIIAGLVLLLPNRDRQPRIDVDWTAVEKGPPAPTLRQDETGVAVAHVDLEKLNAWCMSVAIPEPPQIAVLESGVAQSLLGALANSASKRDASSFGHVGRICESLDAYRHALAYLQLAEKGDPNDFRWPYMISCIHQELGEHDKALRGLNRVQKMEPGYAVTYARIGQLYLESGRLAEAKENLARYAQLRPEDWLGNVGLARVALEKQDAATALGYLQHAVKIGPADFQVQYCLGRTYQLMGREALAKEHFDRAGKLPKGLWFRTRDPLLQESDRYSGTASALVKEFELLQYSKDWPALAGLAERIIQLRSGDVTMMGNLASIYRKMRRFDDALAVLEQAFALEPDLTRLHVLKAETYLSQGRYDLAIKSCERVLASNPESVGALNVLGRASLLSGNPVQGEQAMRRAVDIDPHNAGMVLVLGEILLAMKKFELAKEQYERLLELHPDHPKAIERIDQINELIRER